MENLEIWHPAVPKTPEQMATKFGAGDDVGEPTPVQYFTVFSRMLLAL